MRDVEARTVGPVRTRNFQKPHRFINAIVSWGIASLKIHFVHDTISPKERGDPCERGQVCSIPY